MHHVTELRRGSDDRDTDRNMSVAGIPKRSKAVRTLAPIGAGTPNTFGTPAMRNRKPVMLDKVIAVVFMECFPVAE
jgi:hypothetical protein